MAARLILLPDGRFYDYAVGATIEIPLTNAQARASYLTAQVNFENRDCRCRTCKNR